MLTVNVKAVDGRTVAVVVGTVLYFDERTGNFSEPFADEVTIPVIRFLDGSELLCQRMICPPDMPQSVALANAFANAVGQLGQRQQIRNKLTTGVT